MAKQQMNGPEILGVAAFTLDCPEFDQQQLDVPRQRAHIVAYAVAHGLSVQHWFHGDVLTEEGPLYAPLLQSIAQGKTRVLLVSDITAMQTMLQHFAEIVEALQQVGGEIIAVREAINAATPIGHLLRILVTGCEQYHQALFHSNSPGKFEPVMLRRVGKFGGGIPYGYKMASTSAEDGTDVRVLEIDEDAAKAIRRIFVLRHQRQSLDMIAMTLNTEGHRTALGSLFSAKHVSRILHRQHLYEGRQPFASWMPGQYPAIMSPEEQR